MLKHTKNYNPKGMHFAISWSCREGEGEEEGRGMIDEGLKERLGRGGKGEYGRENKGGSEIE